MKFTHIKTAFVDLDGTLLDSRGCWQEAYCLACEKLEMTPLQNILDMFDDIPFTEWQEFIFKQLGNCEKLLVECAKDTYVKRKPKENVVTVIYALPETCRIFLLTREPENLALHWLKHYKINVFDRVITVGDEREKTEYYAHPSLLLLDDNYKHCMAAKKANALVIGVNDYHTDKRKMQMQNICDLYIKDYDYVGFFRRKSFK